MAGNYEVEHNLEWYDIHFQFHRSLSVSYSYVGGQQTANIIPKTSPALQNKKESSHSK